MLRLSVYADKHHQSFAPINIIHHVEMQSIFILDISQDDCSSLYSLDQEEESIEFLNKDLPTVPPEPIENVKASEAFLTANIYNTAKVKEGSTLFALYAISVCRHEPLTPKERWCVYRRYSDFDDFHILILEKVGSLVNPLKSSVRSMGNMVKNASENLFDGLWDGIIKVLRSRPNASPVDAFLEGSGKVGAGIDIEVSQRVLISNTQDNIPLRIMLLLMDEVFDLKNELKHIIGSDTTRRGMLCVFEMFQHEELNRRLTYVLLEGFLATLFPNNRFHELFRTMHAKSPTISTASASSNNSGKDPPSFSGRRPEVR
ncbi:hypothetical protein HPB47_018586 [Ixodes persulcatus]|uniref:Uncharacterized protein n=1 Tax=Ixodes persulcatus TaxID=34615 RepID=A0AC60R0N0_IXOPE|nr:hypothetical protein HPB47_018586 [Ixodes persulcatus]